MSEQFLEINSKAAKGRILLICMMIFALVFAWLSVRWQFGAMLGELTSVSDPNLKTAAEAAKNLAPDNPSANWLAANADSSGEQTADYETVVRLAPNDFRWWIELGRAAEQDGNLKKAEQAFRRAAELAPEYAYPRWQLGNFYLRQNRGDEAFTELKKAADSNDTYPAQVFAIAWDFYGQDSAKLVQIAGDSVNAKKGLVNFYIAKDRPADALGVFNSLPDAERKTVNNFTKLLTELTFQKRFFKAAEEFAAQSGIDADAKIGAITNGGFEREISAADATYFNWKLNPAEKIEIKTDATQKREGSRSLRVVFTGFANSYLGNVVQFVAVEPNGKYRLSFWAKAENLKSAGTPNIEIVNANDDKMIVAGKPLAVGSSDWQATELEFTAPENCQGITVKIGRAFCGEQCPISGTLWLDDFKLVKN